MRKTPDSVAAFLSGNRYAVAGVSRTGKLPANAIFRKLKASGYEVIPVNPAADTLEGVPCYPTVSDIPGHVDGVIIATPPASSTAIVRQCADKGVRRVWFHRSLGDGSVSSEAVKACQDLGWEPIVGGCPMMFCEPVDVAHRCMRWWLQKRGSVPV